MAAREGRTLDIDATRTALLAAALVAPPGERTAPLAVETAQPKRTTEEAKAMGIVGVVGSYTTTYGGDPNRIHNVQLVSKLIDDHLIPPGALFSFNETTGERNADKGFLEAPVIINGELQTGLGGGVCQVSTTVFNAAFEAGLSIEARTNHALYISHYPLGRDATVNYPDTDLVFKNDTGHWLWLRAFVDSSSLTINLYGTPVDREVVVETSPLEVTGKPPVDKVERARPVRRREVGRGSRRAGAVGLGAPDRLRRGRQRPLRHRLVLGLPRRAEDRPRRDEAQAGGAEADRGRRLAGRRRAGRRLDAAAGDAAAGGDAAAPGDHRR